MSNVNTFAAFGGEVFDATERMTGPGEPRMSVMAPMPPPLWSMPADPKSRGGEVMLGRRPLMPSSDEEKVPTGNQCVKNEFA